jgi:hypothetical protein
MFVGAFAAMLCRPDLVKKTWVGGVLFLVYYQIFLQGLQVTAPGYIEQVWRLNALTGVRIFGAPLEELLFALAFGMYWAGLYEHLTWTSLYQAHRETSRPGRHAKLRLKDHAH